MDESTIEEHKRLFKQRPQEYQEAFRNIVKYEPGDPEFEEADQYLTEYRRKHGRI